MVETVLRPRTERGSVQNALLALLSQRPRHGYDCATFLRLPLGENGSLTAEICRRPDRLARDGLVVQEGVEREVAPIRNSGC